MITRPNVVGIATAAVGALLAVAFTLTTGTGAPGLYGAGFVAVALTLAVVAWDERRTHRRRSKRSGGSSPANPSARGEPL